MLKVKNNFNQNSEHLKEAIVGTIAFFDLFSFPLTQNEIWKYLKIKCSFLELIDALEVLVLKKVLAKEDGLYYLPGKENFILERKKRYNYSDRKFKIALKISKIFRFIPWIRLIAVANLIGRDNLRNGGDIDLFIVSDKQRIWLTRFFTVLVAKFLNVRPRKNDAKDKICLSFFVSEDGLNLEGLREDRNDLYFDYWFLNLAVIYNKNKTFEELITKNQNILNKFPNYFFQGISDRRKIKIIKNSFYKKNWEVFFGGLENFFKKVQLKIMPQGMKKLISEKKGVVVTDEVIKLHLNDKRREFLNRYNENISKIST